MQTSIKNLQNPRNLGIDLIRGFSIIFVILLHCSIRMPLDQTWIGRHFSHSVMNIFFGSAYYGVMIFFVVSGFLITSIAIKRWGGLQNINYQQFYLMRFARVFPCLITLLIILSVMHLLGITNFVIHTTSLKQAIFSALTFHINWLEAKTGYLPGSWDVLWSLSVEEMFYLIFPIICLWIRNEKLFVTVLLGFVILGPFARISFSANDIWQDHSYLSCMDGIALGCLAALWVRKMTVQHAKPYLFISIGLTLSLFVFLLRKLAYQTGLTPLGLNVTILEIGVALLLIGLTLRQLQGKSLNLRSVKIFCWFGKNSYEIYLTHMFAVIFITSNFYQSDQSGYLLFLWYSLILVLSSGLGNLVAKYFSEPMNKMLRNIKFGNYKKIVQNNINPNLIRDLSKN